MITFRTLISGLVGGVIGMIVALFFYLIGLQSSYLQLFFGISLFTGVVSGVTGAKTNELLLPPRKQTSDAKIYKFIGQLQSRYSLEPDQQGALVALKELENLLEEGD